jgi:hypothetical protein
MEIYLIAICRILPVAKYKVGAKGAMEVKGSTELVLKPLYFSS